MVMKSGPLRHRLAPALIASVLLHLVVALWLWRAESGAVPGPGLRPEAEKPSLVELEFTDVTPVAKPPPEAPAAGPASTPRPAPRPVRKPKPTEPVAERPLDSQPTEPQQEALPAPEAGEQDAPRKLVLVPSWPGGMPGTGTPVGEPESRGRTLYPGDPSLEPESTDEASERLSARVQTWADDGAAQVRAGGVGTHPYFAQVRGSLEGALAKTEGGSARQLGIKNPVAGVLKNYTKAAEEYARTGNPGGGPLPPAPTHSEQLAERFKDEPAAERLRMWVQGRETLDALNNRGALLTVILDVHQSRSGELLEAKLAEPSGNPKFDAFVLRVVPGVLGTLPPPPQEALRGRDSLRTQWQVEGWLHTSKELLALANSLASGQLTLPLDLLLEPDRPENARFEYRARLLKVY